MNRIRLENKIETLGRKLANTENGLNYLVIDRRRIKVGFTTKTLKERMKHYENHNSYFQLVDAQGGTKEAEADWKEYLLALGCNRIEGKTKRYEWVEMPDSWNVNVIKKNGFDGLLKGITE